jgi:hypothetical protein
MALSKEYNPSLADEESSTSLLSSEDDLQSLIHQRPSRETKPWYLVLSCIFILLLTNTLTSYLTHLYAIHACHSIAEPPSGAPSIFRDLHLPPRPVLLNTTFYDPKHSRYRQHASLEADKAWNDLSPQVGGVFFVKKEDAVSDGINPDIHAYFDAPELGIDGYPVLVEAMHQVHCLVSLHLNGSMCTISDE